jgi:hypothetical protein
MKLDITEDEVEGNHMADLVSYSKSGKLLAELSGTKASTVAVNT